MLGVQNAGNPRLEASIASGPTAGRDDPIRIMRADVIRASALTMALIAGGCSSWSSPTYTVENDSCGNPPPDAVVDVRIYRLEFLDHYWAFNEPYDTDGSPPDIAICQSFDNTHLNCKYLGEGTEFVFDEEPLTFRIPVDQFSSFQTLDIDYEPIPSGDFEIVRPTPGTDAPGQGVWGHYQHELEALVDCGPMNFVDRVQGMPVAIGEVVLVEP